MKLVSYIENQRTRIMAKQINLDVWQINHLRGLLEKGSKIVVQTNQPIILYRQTIEEEDDSYEEIVCSLANNFVIEQLVTSGGVLVPTFHQQHVYSIDEYPQIIHRKSKERFLEIISLLETKIE